MSTMINFNPRFSSEDLDVRILEGNLLLLLKDFSFTSKTGRKITVKKGFIFNGANIPRYFWAIIGHPFSSKYIRSALIHDLLYSSKVFTRKESDDIFKEMLEIDRVSKWKVNLMYLAVRVGGAKSYSKPYSYSDDGSNKFLEIKNL